MKFDDLLQVPPYELKRDSKERILTQRLIELTEHHEESCFEYSGILGSISYDKNKVNSYSDIPFIPVRLFKELSLKSIKDDEIVKTMTSSGTSGQAVSRIYLDRTTSANQQKAMVKIVSSFIGTERVPMLIIDCPSVIKDRRMFSARGAGILGFSMFGSDRTYILKDEDMSLDTELLDAFLKKHKGKKILLFGFTFMIWQHFYKELLRLKKEGITFDLSNGILIHGGGWKKLESEAVSSEIYKKSLFSVCGIRSIHDYYGMVEQTGCIYMECECGHLHASNFSDVIVRNPKDFSECGIGERGILQVVSSIPESYPGHSLLTEDEGMIIGEDDCPCGRNGKYFKIFGRIKNAEIRGCSDTYSVKSPESDNAEKNNIQYISGNDRILSNMNRCEVKKLFADDIVDFCDTVSKEIFSQSESRAYSDVMTLGFWLRRANLLSMMASFVKNDNNVHVGRGTVFHVAPSNVPVNFAYSLFAGLICGNANVVRIPSENYPQINIIINALENALKTHPDFRGYICLVRYGHDREINDLLSSMCNVRVIWGGDNTISEIRRSPLNPRATEVAFADRYSLAVVDSEIYLNSENKKETARKFWNDTFLTDQNACSSPRIVVFIGNDDLNSRAGNLFWSNLHDLTAEKYDLSAVQSVNKLTSCCKAAANLKNVKKIPMPDNTIYRIQVFSPDSELMKYKDNSGFFFECSCNDISEIREICNDVRCQTVCYIGDESTIQQIAESGIMGIDRIVPAGHTMDFDMIWDGYDLTERLSRTIKIN
ncbi:MAG: acyl-CoA reductase [Porcipelethomonas sp.]